eukprot:2992949-Prymnesium_polylepis.2
MVTGQVMWSLHRASLGWCKRSTPGKEGGESARSSTSGAAHLAGLFLPPPDLPCSPFGCGCAHASLTPANQAAAASKRRRPIKCFVNGVEALKACWRAK